MAPEPAFWTIADTATKIAFAVIGGAWAWLTYIRGRTFRRRLEPAITGQIFVDSGIRFLSIEASVKNVGLSRAALPQRGTWVRIVRLQRKKSTSVAEPKEMLIGTPPIFKRHGWIEPGEEVHDVMLVQLPQDTPEDVAIGLSLRVASEEWRWPTPRDQPQDTDPEASSDPDNLFKRRLGWHAGSIVPLRVPQPEQDSLTSVGGCV